MSRDQIAFEPKDFASREYAEEFKGPFNRYATIRAQGKPSDLAVIEAFEMIRFGVKLDNVSHLGLAADVNPWVQERIRAILDSADIKKDFWSEAKAVHHLMKMIEDPRVRDATRLNAINSLNALCGYVQLDDALAKRVGATLKDFQQQHAAWIAAGSPTTVPTKH